MGGGWRVQFVRMKAAAAEAQSEGAAGRSFVVARLAGVVGDAEAK